MWKSQTVQAANAYSAMSCGCDHGCKDKITGEYWRCDNYPECANGKAERQYVKGSLSTGSGITVVVAQPLSGAPTRATTLPDDPAERKKYPLATGFFDYFPDAIAAIANVSWIGNEQHNPGQPLHWDRSKSADEADTMLRHFAERGTRDKDGARHSAKAAWRCLAYLQKEIEAERGQ